jgi:hypothetical protein
MTSNDGPVEAQPWPAQLDAHVVTPGPRPRVHGYDVEGELAAGGRLGEMALLALTGELPTREALAAVEVALQFAAAVSVAEAPVHATVLGRVSAAGPSGLVSIAAIGLAEQAREGLLALAAWPLQLAADAGALAPEAALARGDDDRASVARLRLLVEATGLGVPALAGGVGRFAAIVSVLVAAGVRAPESIVALFVMARLPVAIAEASRVKQADFRSYPMNTPAFEYEAPR